MAVTAAAAALDSPRPRFFFVWAIVFLAVVGLGFGPTFFARPLSEATDYATGGRTLPLHLLLHGVALTLWFVLFMVQTGLAAAGRIAWHRRLGIAGVFVALAVVATSVPVLAGFLPRVTTWMTAQGMSPERIEDGLRQVSWTIVPASLGLLEFAVLFVAAMYYRRSSATHKRLMLFTSHAGVLPALSPNRFLGQLIAPVPTPLFTPILIGAMVWYDLATSRRVHPATWWGIAANAAFVIAMPVLAGSGGGLAYARWLAEVFS